MPRRLAACIHRFAQSEDGPTAVEYAVMLALIAAVCMGTISLLGQSNSQTYSRVNRVIGSRIDR